MAGAPAIAPVRHFPASVADPLLSVVIVNYRRWEETAALIGQLLGKDSFHRERIEVLVVDNASPPHPLESRLQAEGRVRLLRLDRNRGFGAGVNAGFRQSRGRWLLVLNPDLSVSQDFLDYVCATALNLDHEPETEPPVGVVGFRLWNRDGTPQPSTGFFPTLGKLLLGLIRPRSCRKYAVPRTQSRQRVPWVTGSCLLIRSECLRQLAGFDEEFFLYYEDVDLCLRAQEQGWVVCYEPAVQAIHLDPLQNRRPTAALWAITRHASLTYFRKHLRGSPFWLLGQIVRAEAWLRQRWAEWQGREDDAAVCRQLRGVCRDLMRHRPEVARQRLDELLEMAGFAGSDAGEAWCDPRGSQTRLAA